MHFNISHAALARLYLASLALALFGFVPGTARSQGNFAIYATQFASSGTNLKIYQINNPNLATASEVLALDIAGFSQAGGTILNAPGGTTIAGTTLNSAAWDAAAKRLYFRDNAGSGNLFYWQQGGTKINYVASAATVMPGATSLLGDSGTIYNGGLWYMEDKLDTLYRYDLSANTIRKFTGISGATARTYDYGDIAVSSAGILYINGPKTTGGNNVLDKIDISAVTAAGGSPTWFSALIDYGTNFAGKTQQIAFDNTGTNLYAIQSLAATGSAATTFAAQTWHQVNTTTGAQGATIFTSTNNYSDLSSGFAIPEPAALSLALAGLPMLGVYRRRRRARGRVSPGKRGLFG